MYSRLIIGTFVLPAAAFLVGCGGDDETDRRAPTVAPTATATATHTLISSVTASPAPPTAVPTATATPLVAPPPAAALDSDLARARQLESEGDIEAAAVLYAAVATTGAPGSRAEARLGAGRLLLESGEAAEARAFLEPFAATAAGSDATLHYLLARAYAALERWDEALRQYDLYIETGRAALPYAYLDRSRVLLALDQPLAAATSTEAGLALGLPDAARPAFLLLAAQSRDRAGDLPGVLAAYQTLLDTSRSAGDQALALSRIAAIKRDAADPTYAADVARLLAAFPTTTEALNELGEALGRGETVDATVRGLVYYRHFEYVEAEAAFQAQIGTAPTAIASAEAFYYLAAIQELRGDNEAARANYARVGELNPASFIADDALWWRARLLEDAGSLDEAALLFARLVAEYPASSWADDAAFRRGLLPYHDGRFAAASDAWGQGLPAGLSPTQAQRLALWQGKALLKAGALDAACTILDQIADAAEDDYAGVRARSLLASGHDQPQATRESSLDLAPGYDWQAAEAWLSARTGLAIARPWSADARWARAQELWLVGRAAEADDEASNLIEAYAGDPTAMYTLARDLRALGQVGLSARAGQRLLRTLNANPSDGLPRALLSLSYPAAYASLVQRHASAEGVSPLLLLAFIRQESFFDPRAESGAGALGLTQVLPSTGRRIAARLGVADFETEALLTADLNLRFGTSYMAEQLRDFGDELFVALAAYNAGPNAAKRWRATAGADADLFLETVEFSETRLYIEFVAENYAIFRYLYGGESTPTLPD